MTTLSLHETFKLIKKATKDARNLDATVYCDGILFTWHVYVTIGGSNIPINCEGYVRTTGIVLSSGGTKLSDDREAPRYCKYTFPVRIEDNRYGVALELNEILHISNITQQGVTDRSQTSDNRIELIRVTSKHGTYESGQVITNGVSHHCFGNTWGSTYGAPTLKSYVDSYLSTSKLFDVTMAHP